MRNIKELFEAYRKSLKGEMTKAAKVTKTKMIICKRGRIIDLVESTSPLLPNYLEDKEVIIQRVIS